MDLTFLHPKDHYELFINSILIGFRTKSLVLQEINEVIKVKNWNMPVSPNSLFKSQADNRMKI